MNPKEAIAKRLINSPLHQRLRDQAFTLSITKTSRHPDPIMPSVMVMCEAAHRLELLADVQDLLPEAIAACKALAQHHRHYNRSKSEKRADRLADKWHATGSKLANLLHHLKRATS